MKKLMSSFFMVIFLTLIWIGSLEIDKAYASDVLLCPGSGTECYAKYNGYEVWSEKSVGRPSVLVLKQA